MGFLKPEKTVSEIEEENEVLEAKEKKADLEYSITEKKAMAKKLREDYGLSPSHFNLDWKKIVKFIKEH